MDSFEYVLYLIAMFLLPVTAFVAGWALFTLAFCAVALIKRQPVAPVLKEMLEEW